MAWKENSRICINMQLIAILSRTGVFGSFDWEREKGKVTKSGKTTTFCL